MEYSSMGKIVNGYKYVKGFLTPEELKLLVEYTKMVHQFNTSNFDTGNLSDTLDTYLYGDKIMESLLVNKLPLMEKETNLKLFPTYTYWRMYTRFATLKKHQDRPSCEISVTVTLHSTGEKWPIRMGNNWIDIAPGDAVIYEGCDIEHERKEYDGDGHSQVFLHYVDQNGKNKDYKYDKRHGVGYPQVPRPLK